MINQGWSIFTEKSVTERKAVAVARVHLGAELAALLKDTGSTKKGPVLQTAVIGGIQGAKRTSELIPMCHPLPLSGVNVDIELKGEYALFRPLPKLQDVPEWKWKPLQELPLQL
jgi:GTP cyclohydrolase subunit MoaC